MLKGVNKLIVDVANPDSEFFERAIFFVKPQMRDTPTRELNSGAHSLICSAGKRRKRLKVSAVAGFALAAGLGAAVALILTLLLS